MNQIYNVACNDRISLNQMVTYLQTISGKQINPIHGPERDGDIKHSEADITKISKHLEYNPKVEFFDGLKRVYNWYKTR